MIYINRLFNQCALHNRGKTAGRSDSSNKQVRPEKRINARLVSSQQDASSRSPEAQNQKQSDPEAGSCLVQERELAHSLYIGSIACLRLDQRRLVRCKFRSVPGSLQRPVSVLQSTCSYSFSHLGGDCTLGAAAVIPRSPSLLGHKALCILRTVVTVTVEILDIRTRETTLSAASNTTQRCLILEDTLTYYFHPVIRNQSLQ